MVNAQFTQAAFRVRNDDGSESTATWKAEENVNWEQTPDVAFRIRFAINQIVSNADASLGRTFRLRYSKNGGAYVNIGATSSITEAVRAVNSSNLTDASPTTDQIGGTGTFYAGQVDEGGATGTITAPSLSLAHTELEFCIQVYGPQVAAGDTIDLRVYTGTSTLLDSYVQTPTIIVGKRLAGSTSVVFSSTSALTGGDDGIPDPDPVYLSGAVTLTFTPRHVDYEYLIETDGSTYTAKNRSGTVVSSSGNLKTVLDAVKAANTRLRFGEGTFDFGTEHGVFNTLDGIEFHGAGIDLTIIQNSTNEAADTEPLSFTRCNDVKIRHMTVYAGGSARSTSDAIDNDAGDNWLIEYVKVSGSRARGIVFDGKDPGATADNGVIRNCEIYGTQGSTSGDGIEMLGAQGTLIENCHIHDVAAHGVSLVKGNTASGRKASSNIVRGCTIDQAGRDGINIVSSNDNLVEDCTITNSANVTANRDGIRIETVDGVAADDNVFQNNTITDDQVVKTQRYGINVGPSAANLANNTQILDNYLLGNKTAAYNDDGTNTTFVEDIVRLAAAVSMTFSTTAELIGGVVVSIASSTAHRVVRILHQRRRRHRK